MTRSSAHKLGIGPLDPLPILEPFSETYVRKKKRFPSSTQKTESPKLKVPSVSSRREARVLTRSSAKNKGKSIESPIAEAQSSLEEIHVTGSEAEILRKAKINTSTMIVKKRRRLVPSDSSSSSSHHSIPAPQMEITSSRRLAKKKDKDPLVYYARTPHTCPKNKLRYNSKLINNPRLRDLIINVNDSPPEKKEKKNS